MYEKIIVPVLGRWYSGHYAPYTIYIFTKKLVCYLIGTHKTVLTYDENDYPIVYCARCAKNVKLNHVR